jgi:hypothetical protein
VEALGVRGGNLPLDVEKFWWTFAYRCNDTLSHVSWSRNHVLYDLTFYVNGSQRPGDILV